MRQNCGVWWGGGDRRPYKPDPDTILSYMDLIGALFPPSVSECVAFSFILRSRISRKPALNRVMATWDSCNPLSGEGQFLYRLYEDPDWKIRPENQDNIFSHLVEEFSSIDRSRYHVSRCLVNITRRAVVTSNAISFPRQHQLIVAKDFERAALTDLSRHGHVV